MFLLVGTMIFYFEPVVKLMCFVALEEMRSWEPLNPLVHHALSSATFLLNLSALLEMGRLVCQTWCQFFGHTHRTSCNCQASSSLGPEAEKSWSTILVSFSEVGGLGIRILEVVCLGRLVLSSHMSLATFSTSVMPKPQYAAEALEPYLLVGFLYNSWSGAFVDKQKRHLIGSES